MVFDDIIPIALIISAFLFLPFLIVHASRQPTVPVLSFPWTIVLLAVFIGALVYFELSFQWPGISLRLPAGSLPGPS